MRRPDWTRRQVRYAPELDEQRPGTILAFPDSGVTALRRKDGWDIYGVGGPRPRPDNSHSIARNLPALVVRRGKRRWAR